MGVDQTLEENGRGRLDAGPLHRPRSRSSAATSPRAARPGARGGRLAAIVGIWTTSATTPRLSQGRLAQRQDLLRNQVREVILQTSRPATPTPREKRWPSPLKPLADREDAIRKLAAAFPVPDNPKEPAADAVQTPRTPPRTSAETHRRRSSAGRTRPSTPSMAWPTPCPTNHSAVRGPGDERGSRQGRGGLPRVGASPPRDRAPARSAALPRCRRPPSWLGALHRWPRSR